MVVGGQFLTPVAVPTGIGGFVVPIASLDAMELRNILPRLSSLSLGSENYLPLFRICACFLLYCRGLYKMSAGVQNQLAILAATEPENDVPITTFITKALVITDVFQEFVKQLLVIYKS
jgi:hypothetical protein